MLLCFRCIVGLSWMSVWLFCKSVWLFCRFVLLSCKSDWLSWNLLGLPWGILKLYYCFDWLYVLSKGEKNCYKLRALRKLKSFCKFKSFLKFKTRSTLKSSFKLSCLHFQTGNSKSNHCQSGCSRGTGYQGFNIQHIICCSEPQIRFNIQYINYCGDLCVCQHNIQGQCLCKTMCKSLSTGQLNSQCTGQLNCQSRGLLGSLCAGKLNSQGHGQYQRLSKRLGYSLGIWQTDLNGRPDLVRNGEAKNSKSLARAYRLISLVRTARFDDLARAVSFYRFASSVITASHARLLHKVRLIDYQQREGGINYQLENIGSLKVVWGIWDFKSGGMRNWSLKAGLLGIVLAMGVLSGCSSSEDLPEQAVLITDPINFQVNGLTGVAETNVKAHLNSMAAISKARVRFYLREIRDTTAKALHAYGYYHPEIKVVAPDKDNPKDLTVVVNVKAGKPLFIRNCVIDILGEGSDYKVFSDILKSSTLASYKILDHGSYEQLKNDLQSKARSLGFFDGKFISSRILVYQDQNMADIELIYDTGKRYALGSIVADAETERLLIPVAPLKKFNTGDPFSTSVLNDYIKSLNQTGYYRSVDVRPVVEEAENFLVPVDVHLERRPNNVMRLGVGYSTDEGPRGLIEWDKPLLNERGDSFSSLIKISTVTQNAQAVYKIPRKNPNLDYYTINANQLHTDLNDTVSDLSHLSFHYIANQTGSWRRDYYIKAEYEDYSQASEDGTSTNFMPGVRLTRRETSGGFDPSLGYNFSIEAFGAHTIWSEQSFMQMNASYTGMFSPTDHTRFLFRVTQGVNFGPNSNVLPPSMRYFAGGDNSVRGFGYKAVAPKQSDGSGLKGGRFMTTGSVEFQFPIGIANSRAAVFLDAGLVTDDYGVKPEDDLILGPGVGYRFMSPYGAVRVDFAVGFQHEEDRNYRIHFAFGPEF